MNDTEKEELFRVAARLWDRVEAHYIEAHRTIDTLLTTLGLDKTNAAGDLYNLAREVDSIRNNALFAIDMINRHPRAMKYIDLVLAPDAKHEEWLDYFVPTAHIQIWEHD